MQARLVIKQHELILAVVAYDEQLKLFSLDTHFKEISQFCPLTLETP
jgi:hypothetical protein